MASLLNNRFVVIGLALVAAYFVYQRVVVPLVGDDVATADIDYADDDIDEVIDNSNDIGIETAEQGLQFVTAQYDLQQVSVEALHWNEEPDRDPFAPQVIIDTADVTAVQDKISDVVPTLSNVIRSAPPLPRVSAVVDASDIHYAIVNGEIRQPGDRIGPWRLERVERNAVVFVDDLGGYTRTVRIKQ
ncbi:MAG: hypothetical protein AAFZ58_03095 [Pseudomonadota bacterium]